MEEDWKKSATNWNSFLIDVDRSDIVFELSIKGTGTISKVFSRLEDLGLIKSLGGNSYKISSTFFMFVENKDIAFTTAKIDVSAEAENFLPVVKWLQDISTAEDCQSYCIAYRTLTDKINCSCNNCDFIELINLII